MPMSRPEDGGKPLSPHAVIVHGSGLNPVAIDLTQVSTGYPLLWLSRLCGVSYRDMLNAYETWVRRRELDGMRDSVLLRRWQTVLTEAFAVLSREGILRHPSITPLRWPGMSP